jgi:hypothetical protein
MVPHVKYGAVSAMTERVCGLVAKDPCPGKTLPFATDMCFGRERPYKGTQQAEPLAHASGRSRGWILGTTDMHDLYALFCFVVGGGMALIGYRLLAPSEYPPGASRFAGPILSRHLLIGVAGNLLVVVGLIIGIVFSLVFLLT